MCGTMINTQMHRLMRLKPNVCPDCNNTLNRNGGCVFCPFCGWSSCSVRKINHKPGVHGRNLKGAM